MSDLNLQLEIMREKILRPIGDAASKLPNKELTGFIASKGSRYEKGGLMVVGRAVNRWSNSFRPSMLNSSQECDRISMMIKESSYGKPFEEICPMKWVTNQWQDNNKDYNTATSPFWRVIRHIVLSLNIAKEMDLWSSYLVWSNLYKIAPYGGGNPSNKLCSEQLEGCKTLLLKEINDYQPSSLLFLTGWDWARDFLQDSNIIENHKDFVKASGSLLLDSGTQTRIIVAVHPQGKKEDEWVKQVICEFNA